MLGGADRLVELLSRQACPVLARDHNGDAVRRAVDPLVEADRVNTHPFDGRVTVGDAEAARRVDSPASHETVFRGTEYATGESHDFTSDQIVRYPILDADREPVGVHYPSDPQDIEEPLVWTREGLEHTRESYYVVEKDAPLGQPPFGTAPASWGAMTPEQGLVFRKAHGHPDGSGYTIKITRKTPGADAGEKTTVAVDGETYGQINAADEYYRQAVSRFATGKDVDMACFADAGPAAQGAATSLRAAGVPFDVHASAAEVINIGPLDAPNVLDGIGARVEVDKESLMIRNPWSVHSAAREPTSSD
ncbi:hypothetical protein ABZV91_30495 [Nocardia sp. NPDC004568]|uniref:hypothetical protein n=1 Tax=Nocardia sp. NPDC004568 TaxID=3154551 RepID=UPI00339EB270